MTDYPFGSLSVHRDTDKGREIFVTFDSTGVLTAFNGHVDLAPASRPRWRRSWQKRLNCRCPGCR